MDFENKIGPLRKKTLLVVEDDASARLLIKHLLDRLDIEILESETGEEALELIEDSSFEGMLLDIALGTGINGLALGEKIKTDQRYKNIPMIAITAYEKRLLGNIEDLGFTGYLQKPYSAQELKMLLHEQSLTKRGNKITL